MFLDTDSVSSMNRLVVAVANVINENNENMNVYNEALKEEFGQLLEVADSDFDACPFSQKNNGYYEHVIQNFDDDDYLTRLQIKKSTVQVNIHIINIHNTW